VTEAGVAELPAEIRAPVLALAVQRGDEHGVSVDFERRLAVLRAVARAQVEDPEARFSSASCMMRLPTT
jgi:hypothetical protein